MEMHFSCLQCKCQGRDLPLMRWYAGRLCFGATCCVREKEKKNSDVLLFECRWECIQRAAINFHFLIHMYSSAPCPSSSPANGRVSENYTQDKMKMKPWTWNICVNFMIFSVYQSYLWSFCDQKSLFFAFVKKKYWTNKWNLLTLHL